MYAITVYIFHHRKMFCFSLTFRGFIPKYVCCITYFTFTFKRLHSSNLASTWVFVLYNSSSFLRCIYWWLRCGLKQLSYLWQTCDCLPQIPSIPLSLQIHSTVGGTAPTLLSTLVRIIFSFGTATASQPAWPSSWAGCLCQRRAIK